MRKLRIDEIDRKTVEVFKKAQKIPIIIVLDNVRSLNNIGSAFRTADAFLIEAIYLCGFTACPPHKDIHKTALGATESVDWKYFKTTMDALDDLKQKRFTIVSVEQAKGSVFLEKFEIKDELKYALIFGNEVKGVEQTAIDDSDYCVEIPQLGTKHSLNISVSVGIVLWEFFKSFKGI
ncbi:MAG: RNA methyltransferase [Bacteroidetes bacterium]|jgi:23S rRNA (guanosine2251-2'-O)-methyltransferase|nr:RNA methyltransferase [Bacteroidota bacterium]MBT6686910.1 RNA methyltransferase [Bacteroidota bacterium]MBT7144192.1 RNA methyltransferase [Bacteroidota bacterium]MBT7491575.1 RNA methyltransferase [Bacteroidota bacterium]